MPFTEQDLVAKVLKYKCRFCKVFLNTTAKHFIEHVEEHVNFPLNIDNFDGIITKGSRKFLSVSDGLIEILEEISNRAALKTEKKCPFCPFKSSNGILKHVVTFHDNVCPKCPQIKQIPEEMVINHLKSQLHKFSLQKKNKCSSCTFQTYMIEGFWTHRKTKHAEIIKNVQDVEIKEEVIMVEDSSSDLPKIPHNYHLILQQSHPNIGPYRPDGYDCTFCPSKFRTLFEVFFHVSSMHDPCCPCCNYVDFAGQGMLFHFVQYKHTWYDVSKLMCSVWGCKNSFGSHEEYWQHRKDCHLEAISNCVKK